MCRIAYFYFQIALVARLIAVNASRTSVRSFCALGQLTNIDRCNWIHMLFLVHVKRFEYEKQQIMNLRVSQRNGCCRLQISCNLNWDKRWWGKTVFFTVSYPACFRQFEDSVLLKVALGAVKCHTYSRSSSILPQKFANASDTQSEHQTPPLAFSPLWNNVYFNFVSNDSYIYRSKNWIRTKR